MILATITKTVCLKNRQGTPIFNLFVAMVKYMYPNSMSITYIYVEEPESHLHMSRHAGQGYQHRPSPPIFPSNHPPLARRSLLENYLILHHILLEIVVGSQGEDLIKPS